MPNFLDYIRENSTLDLSGDVDKNLTVGDVHVASAGGDGKKKKKKPSADVSVAYDHRMKEDRVREKVAEGQSRAEAIAAVEKELAYNPKSFGDRMFGQDNTGNAAVDYFNSEMAKLKLKQKVSVECDTDELKALLSSHPEIAALFSRMVGKAGPEDEPRDDHGRWTDGGARIVTKPGSRTEQRGRRTVQVPAQAYAVAFEQNGRPLLTKWTTSLGEAQQWHSQILQTGWSTSARPLPYDASALRGVSALTKANTRTILLMRHGATHLNDNDTSVDRIRGWKNVPLTEEGKEEAAKLAEKIAKDPPEHLVSSDLKRAADTAKMVAAACDLKMSKGDLREGLRPWNVGKFAGQPSKKAVPILCDYAINKPDETVPEGESFNEFYARFTSELAAALKDYPDGVLGVVSHHRNERVLKASEKAGWKPGEIDGKEFSKKGEGTAGFELIDIPQAWLDGVAGGKVAKWVGEDFDISKIFEDSRKDYNPDQPRDDHGRWEGDGTSKDQPLGHGYSDSAHLIDGVVHTNNVYDATRALYEGRQVELTQPKQVSTLIDHLGKLAGEWQKLGSEAPRFDLCKVSVSGTNLFCAENKGIPRVKMPQMDKKTTKAFVDYLKGRGYGIEKDTVKSNRLRATQVEIDGAKVARGMDRLDADPNRDLRRLVVSRGDYILDGHHKWAAQIGVDARDGKLGDHETRVYRVDIGITKLLRLAEKFTGGRGHEKAFGDEPFDFSDVFDDVADDDVSKEFTVEIRKVDAEQQIFYGWAYVSEENGQIVVDKQDDYILPGDLLKAAEDFTLNGGKLGDMHAERNVGRVVASFCTTEELCKAFGLTVQDGRRGWILGFKVDDPQVWAKIKSGDQIELSIGGRGERVEWETADGQPHVRAR